MTRDAARTRVDETVRLLTQMPYTEMWRNSLSDLPESEWLHVRWLAWRKSLGCTSGWPPGKGHIEFHAWLRGAP